MFLGRLHHRTFSHSNDWQGNGISGSLLEPGLENTEDVEAHSIQVPITFHMLTSQYVVWHCHVRSKFCLASCRAFPRPDPIVHSTDQH